MSLKAMALFGAFGAGIILTQVSCVTLEKDECAVANWYELGRADGEKGRRITRASNYRQDCAKFGIPIDDQGYRAGWDVGIRQFCTPENGFDKGINGRFYAKSCPAGLDRQFSKPYDLGRSINELNKSIKDLELKLDAINADLDVDGLLPENRKLLRQERRSVRRELRRTEEDLSLAISDARRQGFDVRY